MFFSRMSLKESPRYLKLQLFRGDSEPLRVVCVFGCFAFVVSPGPSAIVAGTDQETESGTVCGRVVSKCCEDFLLLDF